VSAVWLGKFEITGEEEVAAYFKTSTSIRVKEMKNTMKILW
jgi:hypothetical protein